MDLTTPSQDRSAADAEGQYFARAQALMARRAELFATARVLALDGAPALAPTAPDRPQHARRAGARQLSLPIARERGRRRARMLR